MTTTKQQALLEQLRLEAASAHAHLEAALAGLEALRSLRDRLGTEPVGRSVSEFCEDNARRPRTLDEDALYMVPDHSEKLVEILRDLWAIACPDPEQRALELHHEWREAIDRQARLASLKTHSQPEWETGPGLPN
jgi:hypothetical protein